MNDMEETRKDSTQNVGNTAWECVAAGFGTAAQLAATGFVGAIVGGIKLTTKVIIPAAAKGASDAIEWSRKKYKD